MIWLGLAAFGILGVFCRYLIDLNIGVNHLHGFPLHTFLINLGGSFLIGVIYVLTSEKMMISESWRLVITTGFLGAFTTFSAFSLQNFLLIQEGKPLLAGLYSLASVVAGTSGVFLAIIIVRKLI